MQKIYFLTKRSYMLKQNCNNQVSLSIFDLLVDIRR